MSRVHLREEVDSTNDELRRLAQAGAPEGTVVIAESQTAGRGRRGKRWHSPAGLGLYVSLLVRNPGPQQEATRWTLALAVAACESCNQVAGCGATIKWPNDVQWQGKKLAGVLAEMRSGDGPELVLGCGINARHSPADFPPDVAPLATSLRIASGSAAIDREALCAEFLGRFAAMRDALAAGAWEPIAERWRSLAPGAGDQPVEVTHAGRVFRGRTRGIDSSGGLRVLSADGTLTVVRLTDSVRPLSAVAARTRDTRGR